MKISKWVFCIVQEGRFLTILTWGDRCWVFEVRHGRLDTVL